MHGIETIRQLNALNEQNKPENIAAELAKADAVHASRPSQTEENFNNAIALAKAKREEAIAALEKKSLADLVNIIDGLGHPSTLEAALGRKLKAIINVGPDSPYDGQGHA